MTWPLAFCVIINSVFEFVSQVKVRCLYKLRLSPSVVRVVRLVCCHIYSWSNLLHFVYVPNFYWNCTCTLCILYWQKQTSTRCNLVYMFCTATNFWNFSKWKSLASSKPVIITPRVPVTNHRRPLISSNQLEINKKINDFSCISTVMANLSRTEE